MSRLRAMLGQRVGGVPVWILFVVLVAVAVIVVRRRQSRAAANPSASSPVDSASLDTSTPVGAMMDGGGAMGGYAVPTGSGGLTDTVDTSDGSAGTAGIENITGGGMLLPGGGHRGYVPGLPGDGGYPGGPTGGPSNTTVTGAPTPSTNLPSHLTPPKKSPARSSHKAGRHTPPTPGRPAAPKRTTTVHRAAPHPVVKDSKPVAHPKPAGKRKTSPNRVYHPSAGKTKTNVPGARQ